MIYSTKRTYLRKFCISDAAFLMKLNANPNVLKYTGDKPFLNLNTTELFIKSYSDYEVNKMGRWLVVEKASNKAIGWCGLKKHVDNTVDLGFRFLEEKWNKGFATETAKACISIGFNELKLNTILGRADKNNFASIKVLKKCGFCFLKEHAIEGLGSTQIYLLKNNL